MHIYQPVEDYPKHPVKSKILVHYNGRIQVWIGEDSNQDHYVLEDGGHFYTHDDYFGFTYEERKQAEPIQKQRKHV